MVELLQPHFSVIRPCGYYKMFRISKYNILNDKNFNVKLKFNFFKYFKVKLKVYLLTEIIKLMFNQIS